MMIEKRTGEYGLKKMRKRLTTIMIPIQTVDRKADISKALVKVIGCFALAIKVWRSFLVIGLNMVMCEPSHRSVQKASLAIFLKPARCRL